MMRCCFLYFLCTKATSLRQRFQIYGSEVSESRGFVGKGNWISIPEWGISSSDKCTWSCEPWPRSLDLDFTVEEGSIFIVSSFAASTTACGSDGTAEGWIFVVSSFVASTPAFGSDGTAEG